MNKNERVSSVLDLVARVLLVVETLIAAFMAVGYALYALLDADDRALSAALAGVMAVFAAGLAAFAWGYAKRRRFALSGALAWQLMQASVGVWLLSVWPAVGGALLVLAAIVTLAVIRRLAAYGASEAAQVS
ncbi:hypothetical protein LGT39_04415 [Demequina sp. TTPB684]|uniref:hypothetical protein n=1 Tax=unclassified Demequina TaxID=2620311 RepID=UPI001CF4145D|nr:MULTISPECIES: hypothetical protein [unclassified Demequina]MCB2412092.1 hypothetical protein [Demequina sp. TTPB684]UPU88537.1 hypothetical protein LGT36_001020 [Demequina sp. TMPB413]